MKKYLLILVAAISLVACKSQPTNEFTLDGQIDTAYNGADVFLRYGDNRDTAIVENGKFQFKGNITIPTMGNVAVINNKSRVMGGLILSPGNFTIAFDEKGNGIVTGSKLNETYNLILEEVKSIQTDFGDKYKALLSQKDLKKEVIEKKIDSIYTIFTEKKDALYNRVFSENTDNPIGAEALLAIASTKEKFDSLLNIAGESIKNNLQVIATKTHFDNLDKTSAGKMFIDFTIEDGNKDGSPVKLSDYVGKGKYVLVDFWAGWCGPCKAEMPNLAEVYKKYKGDKFEILGVAVWEQREATEKAMETLPITWPVIYNAQKIPTDIYAINGIPQIILFGPDGTIIARDLRGEAIGKKLAELLKK